MGFWAFLRMKQWVCGRFFEGNNGFVRVSSKETISLWAFLQLIYSSLST